MEAPPNGKIRVLATTNLTQPAINLSGDPIPAVTGTLIGEWTMGAVPAGTTTEWEIEFYNPYTNGQIWIYPQKTSGSPQAQCIIDYVQVCDYGAGITYSSGVIPSGIAKKEFFKIGSSFPWGVGIVTNNNIRNSTCIASTFIDIANNTSIDPGSGIFFEGKIVPSTCAGEVYKECYIYSKPAQQAQENNALTSKADNAGIYPNPNNGSFNVTLPNMDSYDLSVINAVGSIVYTTTVTGGTYHSIDIPHAVEGHYFVIISNKQFKEVKRMMIVK